MKIVDSFITNTRKLRKIQKEVEEKYYPDMKTRHYFITVVRKYGQPFEDANDKPQEKWLSFLLLQRFS